MEAISRDVNYPKIIQFNRGNPNSPMYQSKTDDVEKPIDSGSTNYLKLQSGSLADDGEVKREALTEKA